METTNKYVIFHEKRDEFLCAVKKEVGVDGLGWCTHPTTALKYDSILIAKATTQRIADKRDYRLTICELYESDTKIGLVNAIMVLPNSTSR